MEAGIVGPIALEKLEQVMMNLIGAPGGKALWKERAYLFDDEFRRHVEED